MDPYVYEADEFNRNAPTFRKVPADLNQVTVCFSGLAASKAGVEALAAAACEKYGKEARNRRDSIGSCPLLTPWEAHFDCVAAAPGG